MADSPTKQTPTTAQPTLRLVNALAALSSLVTNTIAITITATGRLGGNGPHDLASYAYIPIIISLAWNLHFVFRAQGYVNPEQKPPAALSALVDFGLFMGFLAVLVANGIAIKDLRLGPGLEADVTLLMAYNSAPWILCGILHVFFVLEVLVRAMGFGTSRVGVIRLEEGN